MSLNGSVLGMRCPTCGAQDDKVIDSRSADDGTVIRRRRQCESCATRFTTFERLEEVPTVVVKRDGRRVPFDREKIEVGVRSACKGRPVDESMIAGLAAKVEQQISGSSGEVGAGEVGELVLAELREIDQVAAVRFASVYKSFEGPEDFQREVQLLGQGEGEDRSSPIAAS